VSPRKVSSGGAVLITEFPSQLTATDALRAARMIDLVRSIADGLVGPRLVV
jgi:hypothetical protein